MIPIEVIMPLLGWAYFCGGFGTCYWVYKRWLIEYDPTGYSSMSLGPVFLFWIGFLPFFILNDLRNSYIQDKRLQFMRRIRKALKEQRKINYFASLQNVPNWKDCPGSDPQSISAIEQTTSGFLM